MATNYNYFGILVTIGLVLNLDAAKLASYPGSGTTWRDISGNGNNGTLTNGPTFSGIGKQAAIVFDGVDDYVGVTNPTILQNQNFSISSWINPAPANQAITSIIDYDHGTLQGWVIQSEDATTNRYYYLAYYDGIAFQPSTGIGAGKGVQLTGSIWQNLIYIKNGTSIIGYLNGSPNYSSTAGNSNVLYSNKNLNIGGAVNFSDRDYNGRIASTQIYNRGISQFEVWQNFNAIKGRYGIPDIVTNVLVLNLDAGNPYSYLSGSSGTTWTNTVAVSSSISGTLVNGPVYANGAISFDGVDDECNLGNVLFNSASATTIDLWVNIPNMSVNRYIMAKGSAGDGIYTFICITGPGPSGGGSSYIRFAMGNQSGTVSSNIEYGNLNFNQWYNFTFTYDGSFLRGYQNATLPQSSSLSGNLYTTTSPIQLASSKYGNFAPSSISNFKIYNRALSAAEITQNFNALRGRYGI